VARDVHESWKKNKVYVCVLVGHGLRSTSFFLGVAKKSEVRIYSARTSLTYPSSFCQASTRVTAGDPRLCKLQRNKHELPVYTPSPNTHGFLVLQISLLRSERRQSSFLIIVPVPVDPPQYYWPLLHVSRFLYFLNKRSQARDNLFSNIPVRELPVKTSNSRKIRIVAGRRFWRFLLGYQLTLSIMAVHAQYRATVPFSSLLSGDNACSR